MEPDLNRLIENAVSCSLSLKGAADEYVNRLRGMKEASMKCDADFQQKKAAADERISQLRTDIQALGEQRRDAQRALEIVQKDIAKGQKEISRLKEEYRAIFDRILEPPRAA
jgi:predicted  nucleic acid-binding Zn-ribbon protein